MVLDADALVRSGQPADAIEARMTEMIPRGRLYFVVDTLEYLAKGGRIGGARALLGELIQIKPILTIREGRLRPTSGSARANDPSPGWSRSRKASAPGHRTHILRSSRSRPPTWPACWLTG
ncbi:MAG: DegV family protein [Chloroflexota bacterium]